MFPLQAFIYYLPSRLYTFICIQNLYCTFHMLNFNETQNQSLLTDQILHQQTGQQTEQTSPLHLHQMSDFTAKKAKVKLASCTSNSQFRWQWYKCVCVCVGLSLDPKWRTI